MLGASPRLVTLGMVNQRQDRTLELRDWRGLLRIDAVIARRPSALWHGW
jgi:hypothetical protein